MGTRSRRKNCIARCARATNTELTRSRASRGASMRCLYDRAHRTHGSRVLTMGEAVQLVRLLYPLRSLTVRIQGAKFVTVSELPFLFKTAVTFIQTIAPTSFMSSVGT